LTMVFREPRFRRHHIWRCCLPVRPISDESRPESVKANTARYQETLSGSLIFGYANAGWDKWQGNRCWAIGEKKWPTWSRPRESFSASELVLQACHEQVVILTSHVDLPGMCGRVKAGIV